MIRIMTAIDVKPMGRRVDGQMDYQGWPCFQLLLQTENRLLKFIENYFTAFIGSLIGL